MILQGSEGDRTTATPASRHAHVFFSSHLSLRVCSVRLRARWGDRLAPPEQPLLPPAPGSKGRSKGDGEGRQPGHGAARAPRWPLPLPLLKAARGLHPSAQAHGNAPRPSLVTNTTAESDNCTAPVWATCNAACLPPEHQ